MMEKYQFDQNFDIFYFKKETDLKNPSTPINEFISFLKFHRVAIPHKFSYVSESGNLLQELTLKQNLLLDYTSQSLTEEKESHFKNYLKQKNNFHLEALYNLVSNINELPSNANQEEIKIIALMKALISEVPFIFLEHPEKDLSENAFKIFKEALKSQFKEQNQNIFIITNNETKWNDVITKIVFRKSDYSFQIENRQHQVEFHEEKKKFFAEKEETKFSGLEFKIPSKTKKTNVA